MYDIHPYCLCIYIYTYCTTCSHAQLGRAEIQSEYLSCWPGGCRKWTPRHLPNDGSLPWKSRPVVCSCCVFLSRLPGCVPWRGTKMPAKCKVDKCRSQNSKKNKVKVERWSQKCTTDSSAALNLRVFCWEFEKHAGLTTKCGTICGPIGPGCPGCPGGPVTWRKPGPGDCIMKYPQPRGRCLVVVTPFLPPPPAVFVWLLWAVKQKFSQVGGWTTHLQKKYAQVKWDHQNPPPNFRAENHKNLWNHLEKCAKKIHSNMSGLLRNVATNSYSWQVSVSPIEPKHTEHRGKCGMGSSLKIANMQMQNFTILNLYFLLKIGDVPVSHVRAMGGVQFGTSRVSFRKTVFSVIRLGRRNQPTGCIQSTRRGENAAVPVNPWARHQLPGTPNNHL